MSRDGLVVLADLAPNLDRESFSAMLAATLAAAETALIEIGRRAPERILVENQGTRLLVVGVSDQLLLAVLANGTTDLGLVQRALTEVGSRVRHAMA